MHLWIFTNITDSCDQTFSVFIILEKYLCHKIKMEKEWTTIGKRRKFMSHNITNKSSLLLAYEKFSYLLIRFNHLSSLYFTNINFILCTISIVFFYANRKGDMVCIFISWILVFKWYLKGKHIEKNHSQMDRIVS